MHSTVKHLANSQCILGESPVWCSKDQTLVFVDILGRSLLSWQQTVGLKKLQVSQRLGALVYNDTGKMISASERGVFTLNLKTGTIESMGFDDVIPDGVLMNDGKCDRQGRFVFGSKDLGEKGPVGELMTFDGVNLSSHIKGTVLNGPAFSPDGTRIYFADSPTRLIYTASYNSETGMIGTPDIFTKLSDDAGYPDGMTVDSEGGLWNAHWDGWRISRYNSNGSLDQEIEMPISKPTSLTFGGDDMQTLFITSAKRGQENTVNATEKMAGDLFAIDVNKVGLEEPLFKGMKNA